MSALFRSASTTAFDKLYRRHAPAVYRYARAVLGNHADAEDVTQQTFLNAYRALDEGTKPRKAENWLFTIAHNEVRRHLRDTRAKRFDVELDEELAGAEPEQAEPSVRDILRALQQLTPNQRSALVMREFEGRSYREIATVMGVSQSALETLVFRARRSLAEALEDGLTCAEAELAVSRRLDGRLSRREARRLKAHMRECSVCNGFERRQKRQRGLLKGLSAIPVPASLYVFRGESAAAAAGGLGIGAAATGGSAGVAAKAAAVVAAVTVAGGVGYAPGSESPVTPVAKATASRQQAARPLAAKVAAVPVARVPDAERAAPARARPDRTEPRRTEPRRTEPRRRAVQPKAEKPAKAKPKVKPKRAAANVAHGAPHPKKVKPVRPLKTKDATPTNQGRATKAKPPKPTQEKRPPKVAREKDVAAPPGQEKQPPEPKQEEPEKPEKTKPQEGLADSGGGAGRNPAKPS